MFKVQSSIALLAMFFLGIVPATAGTSRDNVEISGSMRGIRAQKTEVKAQNLASAFMPQTVVSVEATDTLGTYQTAFHIDKPDYYTIGYTLLYLKPGDKVNARLAIMSFNSILSGDGEELNRYLNSKVPSGWDLFRASTPKTQEDYRQKIDSVLDARTQTLESLSLAPAEFMEMERIRIMALRANAYLNYSIYGNFYRWDDPAPVKLQKKAEFYRTIKGDIEPLLRKVTAKDRYLDMKEVQELLKECHETKVFDYPQSVACKEFLAVSDNSQLLESHGMNQQEFDEMVAFANGLHTPLLKEVFTQKLKGKAKLVTGLPAPDIELQDLLGNKFMLSSLKGKPLFIDFWATWCLPCLAQTPHFEELSKQYPGIQFVGISIDQDIAKWHAKLEKDVPPAQIKEFRADPFKVAEAWDVSFIPRFVLIDKDFNIISGAAPRPSDKENVKELLDSI